MQNHRNNLQVIGEIPAFWKDCFLLVFWSKRIDINGVGDKGSWAGICSSCIKWPLVSCNVLLFGIALGLGVTLWQWIHTLHLVGKQQILSSLSLWVVFVVGDALYLYHHVCLCCILHYFIYPSLSSLLCFLFEAKCPSVFNLLSYRYFARSLTHCCHLSLNPFYFYCIFWR